MQNRNLQLTAQAKALQQINQFAQAKTIYLQILKSEPNNIDVLHLLGILYRQLGEYDTSIKYLKKVMQLNPRIPQLYHNIGLSYKEKGNVEEAINCYRKAIALNPNYAAAYEKLGNAYSALSEHQIAIDHYQTALQLDPKNAEAWNNCGNAFRGWDMPLDAEECFQNALKCQPNFQLALINLAHSFRDQSKIEEPIELFKKALQNDPNAMDAYTNLCAIYDTLCDWQDYEKRQQKIYESHLAQTKKGNSYVSPMNALAYDWKPEDLLNLACIQAKSSEQQAQRIGKELNFKFTPQKKTRLKIGYVSSDFQSHPVAYLTNNLYALHDRQQFEVYGFCLAGPNESKYRKYIQASCDHFVDCFLLKDLDVAKLIYEHGIDILIDLNGHTKGSRMTIFALRPAPIQANYIGYLGTSGGKFFDYILADEIVIPPDIAAKGYVEKMVYLPNYQIFDNQDPISDKPLTRKDYNLPEETFVYCCFNTVYKIQPKIFSVWMEILAKTPNSVLWLYASDKRVEENLRREAQQRNIDPQRLIFTKAEERSIYLARYRLADLFLDTLFYNANTTGSDALWAGLPLLTCPTTNYPGRGAASSLTALGLPELIMPDLATYRETAIRFYENRDEFQKLREKLQKNRLTEPLFDTPRFVRSLEQAYWQMWEIYQNGQSPREIRIIDSK